MRILFVAFFLVALGLSGVFAQNAIVTENQLAGTPQSQWDLADLGINNSSGLHHRHQRQSRVYGQL